MAKKKINNFVFEAGISKDSNLYPNAYALLIANKSFIQAQVVAYINNQIANNIAPFNGYSYEPSKCTRDVGFFIDAVAHDLRYGGNVKIRLISDYFWIDGRPQIRGNPAPEIAGQAYIRDIINNFIFSNTAVTPTYGQTAVQQVILASNGEAGANARITAEFAILSDVITNGINVIPAKVAGVSSIRIQGRYDLNDFLLISNTNTGEVLYNFADPANSITVEYKTEVSSGDNRPLSDVDFRSWYQTTDTITTIYLSKVTTGFSKTDIQIFVEDDETIIKPWSFGTDAIERMRVATPQAMLDADFEYGLQPTKWQQIALQRSYPSFYEIPGTELNVSSITTDASVNTGNFGASLITVTFTSPHNFSDKQPITIRGLDRNVSGYSRAEGSFITFRIVSPSTITYYASARVGTTPGQSLFTNNIQFRQAGFYTGSSIGSPTFTVPTNGSTSTIQTILDTPSGSDKILYTGSTPSPGSPLSGSAFIPGGSSISGTSGAALVNVQFLNNVSIGSNTFNLTNTTGVVPGMGLDDGNGDAVYISTVIGNTVTIAGTIKQNIFGDSHTITGITGSVRQSVGTNATFDVFRESDGDYLLMEVTSEDFAVGDRIRILGTNLNGTSPDNDIIVKVTNVDSTGKITSFTHTGTAEAGIQEDYLSVSGTAITLTGAGAVFSISRSATSYNVTATSAGSNYLVDTVIEISGTTLQGVSPLNDADILISAVGGSGEIQSLSISGIAIAGDTTTIYPALTISEYTTGTISAGTTLNVGAIAQIQVSFPSAHGLVPGASIVTQITSNPAPIFVDTPVTKISSTANRGAWLNNRFVIVNQSSNATQISTDGTNFSSGGTLTDTATWTGLAAGTVGATGYFVAVRTGANTANYSTNDGTTWTASTLPTSSTTTWNSLAYYNGVFIAVRSGDTSAARSTNGGQTWSSVTLPNSGSWTDVAGGAIDGLNVWIAVASGTATGAISLDNGQTWAAVTLPANTAWSTVAYGNNRFIAVAVSTAITAYSTNGFNWTQSSLPSSSDWQSLTFGNNFFVITNTTTSALITTTGENGTWFTETISNGTWRDVTYGDFLGNPRFLAVGSGTNALDITITSANHGLAEGPVIVTEVPSLTTIRYPATTQGAIDTSTVINGIVYSRPDAFFTHRPYDGGVQLGTGGPQHGAQAIRQSKKYIRYQSGKGIMYTTGALFAPSFNLSSATASGTAVNSLITFETDDTEHGIQTGGIVVISGMNSFEYNGTYTVESIPTNKRFTVRAQVLLSTVTGELGEDAKVSIKNWHGATVRSGAFDDQNGIFFQYDGITMAVGRRSSTLQLAGSIAVNTDSNAVTGTATRFQDQLKVGDRIVIKGMSHTVTTITSQTSLTISPDYRGVSNLTGGKACKTVDLLFPQSEWNLDKLDGTGPSGYNFDVTKMQMIGMQYSWYAAGFIEFMLRGADGKFVFFHRIRNSNLNTEAYMRTANLPVRYEVENVGAKSYLLSNINSSVSTINLANASYFPTAGTVYIDNELITYTGKSGDSLTGCTRASTFGNFAAGQSRIYSAGSASSHTAGAGVILVSCSISPVISHWGSALLTDGLFDEDRGYLFSYTASSISVTTSKQTAFLIRLAPSVSNAITGDLGERELLNRAQLLLQEISLAADTGAGGIVVEGVLNPQNYPPNPANITWGSLTSAGAGGQPSFAQIANGGSVSWASNATTSTATIQGQLTANFTTSISGGSFTNAIQNGRNRFFLTDADAAASGIIVGDIVNLPAYFPVGTRIITITPTFEGRPHTRYETDRSAFATLNAPSTTTINIIANQTAASYNFTNYLFFTQSSWISSQATIGTRLSTSVTTFPAGTSVNSVSTRSLGGTTIIRAGFTQSSTGANSASGTITFDFNFAYALPGEQIFSFIVNPGGQNSLSLASLKELTTTAIGGRGAFPNGPDVLAINVYKVSGAAVNANIILRWSEAQA